MGFYSRLARHHTVLAYDKQGCGLSERERTDFSWERDVEDARTVVDQLAPDRLSIFGASQGGPIAIAYAARRREQVDKLVLYGTYARGADVARDGGASFVDLVRSNWGLGSRTMASLFLPENLDDSTALGVVLRWERAAATREMATRLPRSAFRLGSLSASAGGERPNTHPPPARRQGVPTGLGRDLAAGIPKARFVLLEGGGHIPWYGDCDAVLPSVAGFLGDDVAETLRPFEIAAPASPAPRTPPRFRWSIAISSRAWAAATRPVPDRPRADLAVGGFLRGHALRHAGPATRAGRRGAAKARGDGRHGARRAGRPAPASRAGGRPEGRGAACGPPRTRGRDRDDDRAGVLSRCCGPAKRRHRGRPGGDLWEQEKQLPSILHIDGKRIEEAIPAGPKPISWPTPGSGASPSSLPRLPRPRPARGPAPLHTGGGHRPQPGVHAGHGRFPGGPLRCAALDLRLLLLLQRGGVRGSSINTPEKDRTNRSLPVGQEGLLWKDIDLIGLREERQKWARSGAGPGSSRARADRTGAVAFAGRYPPRTSSQARGDTADGPRGSLRPVLLTGHPRCPRARSRA